MLVYVGVLSLMFLVLLQTVISYIGSYKELLTRRAIQHSALTAMERITREIRAAADITPQSVLGTNPGILSLTKTEGGSTVVTKFYLQNGILVMDSNGVPFGPLMRSNASVSNLVFSGLTTGDTKAVKIDMTIQATVGTVTRSKIFHTTVVLKGKTS